MILILLKTGVLQMIYRSITKSAVSLFRIIFPRHVMVNNQDITASNVVEDLNLLVSDDLNWMKQIKNKLLSCNKSFNFIICIFSFTVSHSSKLMFVNMCITTIKL